MQSGNNSSSKSQEKRKPGFDAGAIAEIFYRFVLFLRSPQGIVCFLFPILIWIAWGNVNQYPLVLLFLGLSTARGLTWGCFFYWAGLQCLQLLGGLSLGSNLIKASLYMVERGRSLPDPDPQSSKLAFLRHKQAQKNSDSQKYMLWLISGAAYAFDIWTISMTKGTIVNSFGDFNFSLVFQVAWLTMAFDFLCLVIVMVGENIPNENVRNFLGALRRGEILEMPSKVGSWENRSSK